MNSRDIELLKLRAQMLSSADPSMMSFDEKFQTNTLFPIIHLQSNLFVAVFKNYIVKHKNVFYSLSIEKKLEYIEHTIQRDIKFRNSLKGMIIGHFSMEEFGSYIQNSSSLNKRMMNLVINVLKEQIQLLEYQYSY